MVVVITGGKALADELAPPLAFQELAEPLPGSRVGFADDTTAVQHHHPTGEQIQHILQPSGKAGLLGQFTGALGADFSQFRLELSHLLLEQTLRLTQLLGHAAEQVIGLLQLFPVRMRGRRFLRQMCCGGGHDNSLNQTSGSINTISVPPQQTAIKSTTYDNSAKHSCQSSDASRPTVVSASRLLTYLRSMSARVVRRMRGRSAVRASTELASSSACWISACSSAARCSRRSSPSCGSPTERLKPAAGGRQALSSCSCCSWRRSSLSSST